MKKAALLLASVVLVLSGFTFTAAEDVDISSESVQSIRTAVSFSTESIEGEIVAVAQLKDGSFVGAGSTSDGASMLAYQDIRRPGDTEKTALVFKYATDGSLVFVRTFGGNGWDRFNNIVATPDGGFIATGYTGSTGGGNFGDCGITGVEDDSMLLLAKYDADGQVEWAKGGQKYKIHHFNNIGINDAGEFYGMAYRIMYDSSLQIYAIRMDLSGNSLLADDFVLLPEVTDVNYDIKYFEDDSFVVSGTRQVGERCYAGVVNRYDKDGHLLFAKTFSGNGSVQLDSIIPTSDNEFLVVGRFYYCTKGSDFDALSLELPDTEDSGGSIVLKYDLDGNLLGGDIMSNLSRYGNTIMLRGLAALDDGDALVQVFPGENNTFKDPISGQNITDSGNSTSYLYRIDADGHFQHLYHLESNDLIGVYGGIASFQRMPDGAFRIIGFENNTTSSKMCVIDVVDKFLLEKAIDDAVQLERTEYTLQSWQVFVPKLESAVIVNKSPSTNQKTTNAVTKELNTAIVKLVKLSSVNSSGNLSTAVSQIGSSMSSSQDSDISGGSDGSTIGGNGSNESNGINSADDSGISSTVSDYQSGNSADVTGLIAAAASLDVTGEASSAKDGGSTFVWIMIGVIIIIAGSIWGRFLFVHRD
ncbi:MAG: hypothetical protein ACYCYM_13175 [Saccharofermentanales bacterium]